MDRRIGGPLNGRRDGPWDGRTDGRPNEQTDERTDRQTDERTDGRMDHRSIKPSDRQTDSQPAGVSVAYPHGGPDVLLALATRTAEVTQEDARRLDGGRRRRKTRVDERRHLRAVVDEERLR